MSNYNKLAFAENTKLTDSFKYLEEIASIGPSIALGPIVAELEGVEFEIAPGASGIAIVKAFYQAAFGLGRDELRRVLALE